MWVWPSWGHCISCTCTTLWYRCGTCQMADMCLVSSSDFLYIRWSMEGMCAVDLWGGSLWGSPWELMCPWAGDIRLSLPVNKRASGIARLLRHCCRKGKISSFSQSKLPGGHNLCTGHSSFAQPERRKLGVPCPIIWYLPWHSVRMRLYGAGTRLGSFQMCPALLEWEWWRCCMSSNTRGTWWDVVCAEILIDK